MHGPEEPVKRVGSARGSGLRLGYGPAVGGCIYPPSPLNPGRADLPVGLGRYQTATRRRRARTPTSDVGGVTRPTEIRAIKGNHGR
jgi:hypothetical protein